MVKQLTLESILFGESTYTDYSSQDFGLFHKTGGTHETFILYNIPALLAFLRKPYNAEKAMVEVCAGMIEIGESGDECLGAAQVGVVVGNPKWPGAGITLYALASNYLEAPLTSDRNHSSSETARKLWAKIENHPEWKKVGTDLDNYARLPAGEKQYVDIMGSYPDRDVFILDEPKTPEKVDDCSLPTKYGDITDPKKMAAALGTANAYRYVGPLNAQRLITWGKQAADYISANEKTANPKKIDIEQFLQAAGTHLFKTRYTGAGI